MDHQQEIAEILNSQALTSQSLDLHNKQTNSSASFQAPVATTIQSQTAFGQLGSQVPANIAQASQYSYYT